MKHVVRRAIIIYAIGFFLYAFPDFNLHTVRLMGVLQRIAVVYLIAGALVLYTGKKTWAWVTGALLVGYWLLMTRIPGFDLTMDGNLAGWIDRHVMYEHLYIAHRWDPEGLLHTLPAIGTCLLGVFTGMWLKGTRRQAQGTRKISGMLAAGVVGIVAGELWGLVFPINKNMWTSSYVLFTAGVGLVLLAGIQWLSERTSPQRTQRDAKENRPQAPWWGRPFVWYGSNAITLYALSSFTGKCSVAFHTTWQGKTVLWKTYLYERFFAPLASPIHASLLWALAYVLTFGVLAWIMYRKAIFIKI